MPVDLNSFLPKNHAIKDGSQLTIREASASDAESVIGLVRHILETSEYTLTTPEEFTYTIEEEARFLTEHADDPEKIYLVAEQNGQLVGNLHFTNGPKKRNQHQGELAMGIRQEYRGKGIGTLLLSTLIEWAQANPLLTKVTLQVFIQNSHAIHLYKNLGFIEEGRLRNAIKMDDGEYMDVIVMYKFV